MRNQAGKNGETVEARAEAASREVTVRLELRENRKEETET